MTIQRILAQSTVTDGERAVSWYAQLFDRAPDARPMDGLYEWHLGPSYGVQVWVEPERAGHSSMVLDETDLDELEARLTGVGLEHPEVQQVTSSRLLPLIDPDGNRVSFTGP